jgi:hypothetical protein
MRTFSTSIFAFVSSLFVLWGAACHSDTLEPAAVRQATEVRSIWTRKAGSDWPRMLGPNYDSHSPEIGILKSWPKKGLKVIWTADAGVGYGNGVASQGRWFQFDRYGDVERLSCLNAETGAFLWKWESPVQYRDPYGYNNGPRCSPIVDGNCVYVFGVTGTLACVAVDDGRLVWRRDTNQEFNVSLNFFGVGASPLVYEDNILVMIGGSPQGKAAGDPSNAKPAGSAMVAFDKKTGKEAYRVGDYLASYSAPVVQKIEGKDVCLSFVREGLLTFNPVDGSDPVFFPWRSRTLESVNAASPVVWNDHILISECYEIGSVFLKLRDHKLEPRYRDGLNRKDQVMRAHWSTPLLDGNTLISSSGRNEPDTDLRCLALQENADGAESVTPRVGWTSRNRDRMTGLIVDKHALMLGESGVLQLIALDPEKRSVVAEMQLAQIMDPRDGRELVQTPSWAPPVLSHGLLYVRGADKVVCLELIPE